MSADDGNFCCRPDSGDCCGPASWCCKRAGVHEHPEEDEMFGTAEGWRYTLYASNGVQVIAKGLSRPEAERRWNEHFVNQLKLDPLASPPIIEDEG